MCGNRRGICRRQLFQSLFPVGVSDVRGFDAKDEECRRGSADHELAARRIREEAERELPLEDKIKELARDYWPEILRKYQPYQAYAVNMKSMLERGIFH